eukprot:6477779-Amphidinium_carterae.1
MSASCVEIFAQAIAAHCGLESRLESTTMASKGSKSEAALKAAQTRKQVKIAQEQGKAVQQGGEVLKGLGVESCAESVKQALLKEEDLLWIVNQAIQNGTLRTLLCPEVGNDGDDTKKKQFRQSGRKFKYIPQKFVTKFLQEQCPTCWAEWENAEQNIDLLELFCYALHVSKETSHPWTYLPELIEHEAFYKHCVARYERYGSRLQAGLPDLRFYVLDREAGKVVFQAGSASAAFPILLAAPYPEDLEIRNFTDYDRAVLCAPSVAFTQNLASLVTLPGNADIAGAVAVHLTPHDERWQLDEQAMLQVSPEESASQVGGAAASSAGSQTSSSTK